MPTVRPAVFIGILLAFCFAFGALARDVGQWENSDPSIREWYQTLMQPDNPTVSCCSFADAYYADEIHVRDGKVYAVITDDRPLKTIIADLANSQNGGV